MQEGEREEREGRKRTTQGHTETRQRKVAEHTGRVQYVPVIEIHTVTVFMLEEETTVGHGNRI